jgi:GT2 family glycosyltransferase
MPPPPAPDVSVCVPVYRAHDEPDVATLAADLPAALDGLQGELVVALNGIDARAAGVPDQVHTIPSEVNRGVGPGWNTAAAQAAGATLCFCNDDVRLARGALRRLHETLHDRPEAGVVGPVGTRWDVGRARHLDWIDTAGLEPGDVRECEVVSGFLFATRRDTFDAAGGFDEAYAPYSYEEADYCTAVRLDLGLRCYAVAGVGHEHTFGVSAVWRPWRRVRFDGRSESVWSIDRRNRRHFLAKWADRAAAAAP